MLRMKIKLCGLIFFFGSCIVTVRQSCRDCIGVYSITNQIEECVNLPASRFETNYGLMLLSTKELINGTTSGFIPQSQFRGYLEASVCDGHRYVVPASILLTYFGFLTCMHALQVDGVGDLVCTHLTSPFPTEFYGNTIQMV